MLSDVVAWRRGVAHLAVSSWPRRVGGGRARASCGRNGASARLARALPLHQRVVAHALAVSALAAGPCASTEASAAATFVACPELAMHGSLMAAFLPLSLKGFLRENKKDWLASGRALCWQTHDMTVTSGTSQRLFNTTRTTQIYQTQHQHLAGQHVAVVSSVSVQ